MISFSAKQKNIIVLILIGLLLFAGVSAMLYPTLSNIVSLRSSLLVIEDYDSTVHQMTDNQLESRVRRMRQYNTDLAGGKKDSEYIASVTADGSALCYLDAPTIDAYLPVYYGTDDEVLQKGCGLLSDSSLPIGGKGSHAVISGHTGLPSADLLTNLDKMKISDVFYIHILNEVLAYRVDQILVVSPFQTEHLAIDPDHDYVTLLTCTPYGVNNKRLLVRGTRVAYSASEPTAAVAPQPDISANDAIENQIRKQSFTIVAVYGVVLIVYGIMCYRILKPPAKRFKRDFPWRSKYGKKREKK